MHHHPKRFASAWKFPSNSIFYGQPEPNPENQKWCHEVEIGENQQWFSCFEKKMKKITNK